MTSLDLSALGFRGAVPLVGFFTVLGLLLLVGFREWTRVRLTRSLGLISSVGRSRIIFYCSIAGFMFLAILRPYWGFEDVKVPRVGRDIIVVVDVSHSMKAEDVAPNRLGVAQRKMYDLLELLARESPGDRVGLVLFAGESYLYCPLTADYGVVRVFVDALPKDLITTPGSVLGEAITVTLEAFRAAKASARRLIILTDGEDSSLEQEAVVQLLRSNHLSPGIIGVGTIAGIALPPKQGRVFYDHAGRPVVTALQEVVLKKIAADAGGTYSRVTLGTQDLRQVLNLRDGLTEKPVDGAVDSIRVYHEFGALLLLVPLGLWLGAVFTKRAAWIFPVLLGFSLLFAAELHAEDPATPVVPTPTPVDVYEARQLLDQGDFEAAEHGFADAFRKKPDDSTIREGYGAALFRNKKFSEAERIYRGLDTPEAETRVRYLGRYNAGNAALADGKFAEAIAHYNEALTYKPGDAPAAANRSLAIELQRRRPTPTPTPTPTPQSSPQQSPSPSPSASASPESSPEPTPTARGTGTQAATPSGAATPTAQNAADSKDGTPEASPTSTQDDSDDEKQSGTPTPNPHPSPAPAPTAGNETQPLSESEAQSWLDSLPDAPMLLERRGSHRPRGGQEW